MHVVAICGVALATILLMARYPRGFGTWFLAVVLVALPLVVVVAQTPAGMARLISLDSYMTAGADMLGLMVGLSAITILDLAGGRGDERRRTLLFFVGIVVCITTFVLAIGWYAGLNTGRISFSPADIEVLAAYAGGLLVVSAVTRWFALAE
jgi:hypothetical protein